MIGDAVICERVNEDVQVLAVEHQPRDETCEFLNCEGHLVHRDGMRSDRLVMPASDPGLRETLTDGLPQPFGYRPGLGSVVKVGVIALD
jgi:hypothetical protein